MNSKIFFGRLGALLLGLSVTAAVHAASHEGPGVRLVGLPFADWQEAFSSEAFRAAGGRCGTLDGPERLALLNAQLGFEALADASDCSGSATNPSAEYAPGTVYQIPVVVHIIMNNDATQGALTDAQVQSQIDILNEDFQALAGTNGAAGINGTIRFVLASQNPSGQATTGITRHQNNTWFNDSGSYWNTLAWDPHRYLNIYTNTADGALGYVPFLPADGGGSQVGEADDRVVILWSAFGRNAPGGSPYNQGRTATHEVGHFLGLEHTFQGGCATASVPGCYSTGDLICDTPSEQSSRFGCPAGATSCSSPDPIQNYMDYTDDLCMNRFSQEQIRRMRCSLQHYRSNLYTVVTGGLLIFADGFESGNTSAWSAAEP